MKKVIPFITLGFAIIFGVVSYSSAEKMINFANYGVSVQGEVVDFYKKEGTRKSGGKGKRSRVKTVSYAAIVMFQSEDGVAHRFQDSVAAKPSLYEVGDRVNVIYLPDNPKQAIVDHGVWNWTLSIVFGLFSLLLFYITRRVFDGFSSDRV